MTRPAWRQNVSELLLDPHPAGATAVAFPGGSWTRAELRERVVALAGGLAGYGVAPGHRVALILPDSPMWVAAFLALARLGAVVVPASPATPAARIGEAIARAAPTLLLTDDEDLLPEAARLDTAALRHLCDGGFADPGPAATRASDPCYLLLTSGSTGPSKWAVHRHGDIAACLATYGHHVLRLRPGDMTWSVAALPTSYGLGNSLYFPLGAGAGTWVTGEFPTPLEAARACGEGGANVLFGVPTFWSRLARHARAGRLDTAAFASVQLAVSAGEPLPPSVWRAVRDAVGLELVDGLGSSEATNLYLSNRPGRARADSVGSVVPGFELRVVDDDGEPVGAGVTGELLVQGASVMSGYLDAPDATAEALRGGWLHTGDLVERRVDATYRFVGRVGERFKSGGFWVDPARVEAALLEHPSVAEAAVAGVPDSAGVVRVVALVVARNGVGHGELRERLAALAAAELSPHEVPRDYVFTRRLPTAPSGKVRRGELRGLIEQATAESGPV